MKKKLLFQKIGEKYLHPHIKERMRQRGITLREINETLEFGWRAKMLSVEQREK